MATVVAYDTKIMFLKYILKDILDFKISSDLSFMILNAMINKLYHQNLYLDTKIMFLKLLSKEILAEIEILNNHGSYLGFQYGPLILHLNGIIRKLDPQNLYLNTKVMLLICISKAILA